MRCISWHSREQEGYLPSSRKTLRSSLLASVLQPQDDALHSRPVARRCVPCSDFALQRALRQLAPGSTIAVCHAADREQGREELCSSLRCPG